jgi:hypothetical protein
MLLRFRKRCEIRACFCLLVIAAFFPCKRIQPCSAVTIETAPAKAIAVLDVSMIRDLASIIDHFAGVSNMFSPLKQAVLPVVSVWRVI